MGLLHADKQILTSRPEISNRQKSKSKIGSDDRYRNTAEALGRRNVRSYRNSKG